MHEIGIANSILDAVRAETARRPEAEARKVVVRVGALAAVDPDALQFSFQVLTRGTELAGIELEIVICSWRHRCPQCRTEFLVNEHETKCPQCAETRTECISGDELELAYLEMEEHEPSTA
jgi:hydrogenase nickel incorporation protein HypA/HybF